MTLFKLFVVGVSVGILIGFVMGCALATHVWTVGDPRYDRKMREYR